MQDVCTSTVLAIGQDAFSLGNIARSQQRLTTTGEAGSLDLPARDDSNDE
jgi:hypothetical protein